MPKRTVIILIFVLLLGLIIAGVMLIGRGDVDGDAGADAATEEATVDVTDMATEEATEPSSVTDKPGDVPTEEATSEATEAATEEATEEATIEATEEAVNDSPRPVVTEEPTEEIVITEAPVEDVCAEHGGIQWQGEACTCGGIGVWMTICSDGAKFDGGGTGNACSPDPNVCGGTGGDGSGGSNGGSDNCNDPIYGCEGPPGGGE